jgi:salicylate hydroxylase
VAHPILIAGGGIGGLAAALAFARIGRASVVLERQITASEAGAGIQLGPNAVKALRQLGVADALQPFVSTPDAFTVRHRSGRLLARTPLGQSVTARYGAPYWVAHRADLHAVLAASARRSPHIAIETACDVIACHAPTVGNATLRCADGRVFGGAAIVGADGVGSTVRTAIAPHARPKPSGYCAFRTLIPTERAGDLAASEVGAWLSGATHVVHYPVQAGRAINVVVIVRDAWQTDDWSSAADAPEVMRATADFPPELRTALAAAPHWQKWMLAAPITLATWTQGRIALLGDAAHAILPFQAQGGAMALEDAVQLAASVRAHGDDLPAAFAAYVAARRPRVARICAASSRNGQIFHLNGAAAFARDTALRVMPAQRLLTRLDWLYGFEGPSL